MPQIDPDKLLPIVVGSHLSAEAADRALAYSLLEKIRHWLQSHRIDHLQPLVLTDVWYLNHAALQQRPTISIGGPGVNALSAYFHEKLPTALQVEEQLLIQFDVEMTDLRASIWGMDRSLTAAALELFAKKYLDEFLRAVVTQVEPE